MFCFIWNVFKGITSETDLQPGKLDASPKSDSLTSNGINQGHFKMRFVPFGIISGPKCYDPEDTKGGINLFLFYDNKSNFENYLMGMMVVCKCWHCH